MAPHSLSSFAFFTLCTFLLVLHFHTFCWTCGLSVSVDDNSDPAAGGMCAAAVAVHDYECQEFDVLTDDGFLKRAKNSPRPRWTLQWWAEYATGVVATWFLWME